MSDEQANKPKFEPPPWEQEAFERFRAEQEEQRKQAELDAALLAAQQPPAEPAATSGTGAQVASGIGAIAVDGEQGGGGAGAAAPAGVAVGVTVATVTSAPEPAAAPTLSDARIDSMLIQLKGEEPPSVRTNLGLVNAVIAGFALAGIWLIVEAALLFSKTRASGAAGMLGAVASLIILLAGFGFLGGGFLLFRKYHL
jgi:hypothetical protein